MHVPVLLNEVIDGLGLSSGHRVIDGTINGGGHGRTILESIAPDGKLLGIDLDKKVVEKLNNVWSKEFSERFVLAHGNFSNLESIARRNDFNKVDAVLFDLGMSSWDIEDSGRGFSFKLNEPLDMRYDPDGNEITAASIVNSYPLDRLEEIFKKYGEERNSMKIAKAIVRSRKMERIITTKQLVNVISSVIPGRGKIHPATKVFQALRIETNSEFENIRNGLEGAYNTLRIGGRIAVITFHSLEDRIVKLHFNSKNDDGDGRYELINKKPITASPEEIYQNKKSRSAKLRIAQKISNEI